MELVKVSHSLLFRFLRPFFPVIEKRKKQINGKFYFHSPSVASFSSSHHFVSFLLTKLHTFFAFFFSFQSRKKFSSIFYAKQDDECEGRWKVCHPFAVVGRFFLLCKMMMIKSEDYKKRKFIVARLRLHQSLNSTSHTYYGDVDVRVRSIKSAPDIFSRLSPQETVIFARTLTQYMGWLLSSTATRVQLS